MVEQRKIVDGVVVDGKKCKEIVNVPEGVHTIGDQAFYRNKELTGLILPESVTAIGKYAVNGCKELAYVSIPASVCILGEGALIKRFESNFGFTHVVESKEYYPVIRCKEGSFIDSYFKDLKEKDGWKDAHSNEHLVVIEYV